AMSRGRICCLLLLLLLLLLAALALLLLLLLLSRPGCSARHYLHGAVAADTESCSLIGRNILKSGGTAVDAAIAGLVCTSVMNPQSSGLGGGVIFTIYNASTGAVEVINARETVPRVFPPDLLSGCHAGFPIGKAWCPRWIGVPGELRGYEEAHRRHGRLPWKALFEPTIKLLSEPLVISPVLDKILHHPAFSAPGKSLCPLLCDGQRFLKGGETFRWRVLQQTLQAVAEHGAAAFYEGEIGRALVEDVRKAGSSLSLEDLRTYKAQVSSALNITLNNDTKVFAPGPPMGGAVLMFILKVLEEYKFHKASLATPEEKVETYHYIAEALKFGNMLRPHMSDPAFSEAQVPVGTLLSEQFAEFVRQRIDSRGDHPLSHYSLLESLYNDKHRSLGTSHISVLAADGSAVSATSTINYPFGSFVYSNQTGIILNNELADFCIANRSIKPDEPVSLLPCLEPHGKNNISASALGEKPPSAMVPSILISKSGDMLVIGGAGGGWIISATTMVIINKLWFGYDLEQAISAPVMHAQGDSVLFEEAFSKEVRTGLLGRGHKEKKDVFAMNVVQGISKEGKCISAYSDKRKLGKSAGY
ncbi:GGT5 hydrolase, partial [Regulus satrapa]|nr:GGT5 hydrolase [Regulus satrapa]